MEDNWLFWRVILSGSKRFPSWHNQFFDFQNWKSKKKYWKRCYDAIQNKISLNDLYQQTFTFPREQILDKKTPHIYSVHPLLFDIQFWQEKIMTRGLKAIKKMLLQYCKLFETANSLLLRVLALDIINILPNKLNQNYTH